MSRPREHFSLKIGTYKNRSGSKSFRVSGMFKEEHIRKNFKTLAEANAFLAKSEREAHEVRGDYHMVQTRLGDKAIVDAEDARAKLDEAGFKAVTLSDTASDYIRRRNIARPIDPFLAVDAYEDYLNKAQKRSDYVDNICRFLRNCFKTIEVKWIADVPTKHLESSVLGAVSTATQRTRRAWLSGFYSWLVRNNHVAENIVKDIPPPKHRKALPEIFDLATCKKLLNAAAMEATMRNNATTKGAEHRSGVMLPYVSVCLLSAVRPEEAMRLDSWEFFDLTGHKHIEVSENITKTRARFVPIHTSLLRILKWCKAHNLRPGFYSKTIFSRIREAAGVDFPWKGVVKLPDMFHLVR